MATLLKSISALESPKNVDFEVTTCFIEYKGKYLVLQRGRKDAQYGLWGIPGGKLDEGENPLSALTREIFEETGIFIPMHAFSFLEKAHSINIYDGSYILYLYKVKLTHKTPVHIDSKEHTAYKWVSLEEFSKLNLLVSQGPAFGLVKNKLLLPKN